MSKIRFYENIHILFWLLKDLSWVMIWKPLGIIMILPTIGFAIWFCIKSFQQNDFFIHLATLFWISANTLWMLLEFLEKEEYKFLAALIFISGIVSISYYIYKELLSTKNSS